MWIRINDELLCFRLYLGGKYEAGAILLSDHTDGSRGGVAVQEARWQTNHRLPLSVASGREKGTWVKGEERGRRIPRHCLVVADGVYLRKDDVTCDAMTQYPKAAWR